jgi:hypothetical protein
MEGMNICRVHRDSNIVRSRCGNKFGWVYVFDTGFELEGKRLYKIGKASNPARREGDLRVAGLGKMIFSKFLGEIASDAEHKLHKTLRGRGFSVERELYALDYQALAFVKDEICKINPSVKSENGT